MSSDRNVSVLQYHAFTAACHRSIEAREALVGKLRLVALQLLKPGLGLAHRFGDACAFFAAAATYAARLLPYANRSLLIASATLELARQRGVLLIFARAGVGWALT